MPFRNIIEIATAVDEGRHHVQQFFRSSLPSSFTAVFTFADASVGTGTPSYNPYASPALEATQLIGERNKSIYAGPQLTTQERYLLSIQLTQGHTSNSIGTAYFLDYLLSYSLIDLDRTDQQQLINLVSLPRYSDGEGVRMMLVMQTPGITATPGITINYTNQDGAPSTVTGNIRTSAIIGAIAMFANPGGWAPFLPLANGDTGVRSVESVQLVTAAGGFGALVLVRPLFTISSNEIGSTIEKNFILEHAGPPRIYEGAFLNYIFNLTSNTAITPLSGKAEFVWTN